MSQQNPTERERGEYHSPALIDPVAVREQLGLILASDPFCHSKRFPRFLQFIVEQTLSGRADQLKERVIGIEVFGKVPNYDLSVEPIVRVTAGEIRRRLAQYYLDHPTELRIQLHLGSYVPEFQWPEKASQGGSETDESLALLNTEPSVEAPVASVHTRRFPISLRAVSLGLFCGLVFTAIGFYIHSQRVNKFWEPVLSTNVSPLVCLGDPSVYIPNDVKQQNSALQSLTRHKEFLAVTDVLAFNEISPIVDRHKIHPIVQNSTATTFADLRQHPVILIGGRDNPWSIRAMESLRYQIVKLDDNFRSMIRDSQNPAHMSWAVDNAVSDQNVPQKTYGLIARYRNPETGQPTILIAGIGLNGTRTAAEFVSSSSLLKELDEHAPPLWNKRNCEIVLEAEVINGDNGPPHIVAIYCW